MFSDTFSANRINSKGIFADVSFTSRVNHLAAPIQHNYITAVEQTLSDMASIRDNPAYCQFVGTELGLNLERGFANLKESPLVIESSVGSDYPRARHGTRLFPERGFYAMELFITDYSLKHETPEAIRATIGHETGGHALATASRHSASDIINGMARLRSTRQSTHTENWHEEFNADALSVAGNPENSIGQMLAQDQDSNAWLNNAYHNNKFGPRAAKAVAGFCMARDDLLIRYNGKQMQNQLPKINDLFRMSCSITHPPQIARAVAGEEFAKKAQKFLAGQSKE